jgi:hypothetical protein
MLFQLRILRKLIALVRYRLSGWLWNLQLKSQFGCSIHYVYNLDYYVYYIKDILKPSYVNFEAESRRLLWRNDRFHLHRKQYG